MTLQQIIYHLKQKDSDKVLDMIQNANRAELTELRDSIDLKLELEKLKYERDKNDTSKF